MIIKRNGKKVNDLVGVKKDAGAESLAKVFWVVVTILSVSYAAIKLAAKL